MRRPRFQDRRADRGRPGPSSLFDGLDPVLLARVTELLGTRMIQANAFALVELSRDETVDPTTMSAGLLKAHLHGAASALQSGLNAGTLTTSDLPTVARDAAQVILDALSAMKAAA